VPFHYAFVEKRAAQERKDEAKRVKLRESNAFTEAEIEATIAGMRKGKGVSGPAAAAVAVRAGAEADAATQAKAEPRGGGRGRSQRGAHSRQLKAERPAERASSGETETEGGAGRGSKRPVDAEVKRINKMRSLAAKYIEPENEAQQKFLNEMINAPWARTVSEAAKHWTPEMLQTCEDWQLQLLATISRAISKVPETSGFMALAELMDARGLERLRHVAGACSGGAPTRGRTQGGGARGGGGKPAPGGDGEARKPMPRSR
jgi:hypothetical protein